MPEGRPFHSRNVPFVTWLASTLKKNDPGKDRRNMANPQLHRAYKLQPQATATFHVLNGQDLFKTLNLSGRPQVQVWQVDNSVRCFWQSPQGLAVVSRRSHHCNAMRNGRLPHLDGFKPPRLPKQRVLSCSWLSTFAINLQQLSWM